MAKRAKKSITRNDVAKLAGVSTGTVSFVINDVPNTISKETRSRVLTAVKKLGYMPNTHARSLTSGKSYNIGIAFYDIDYVTHHHFARTIPGVSFIANKYNYGIQFLCTCEKLRGTRNNFYFMDKIKSKQVDGIIFQDEFVTEDILNELSEMNFPYVMINREISLPDAAVVLADYRTTMQDSVDYLVSLGHKYVGFIMLQAWKEFNDMTRMIPGFQDVARCYSKKGVKGKVVYFGLTHPPNPKGTFYDTLDNEFITEAVAVVKDILKTNPKITAYICYQDGVAVVIHNVFTKLGVRIPQDISLIGINNDPPGAVLNPPLTTNDIPSEKMGERATELLFQMINNKNVDNDPEDSKTAYLSTKLIIRGSCGRLGEIASLEQNLGTVYSN